MGFIRPCAGVDLEHPDACRVLRLGHSVQDPNARLEPDGGFNLFLNCSLIAVELSRIDLKLGDLDVSVLWCIRGMGLTGKRERQHQSTQNKQLLAVHRALLSLTPG